MQQTFLAIAEYAIPPLLGAGIGYLTNYVAIRMLFRPLKEYRFAGIRVPFTPGIIPKQRHDLAQSIARMVSTQLLTEDAVRTHLRSPRFQAGIRSGISNLIDEIGARQRRLRLNEQSVMALEELAGSAVSRLVESERFQQSVGKAIEGILNDLAETKVGDLFDGRSGAKATLESLVDRALDREELRSSLVEMGMRWLRERQSENTKLSEIIPENFVGEVARLLVGVYDPALNHLLDWLRRDDIRAEIEIRGKVVLRDVLDKLNVLQRFFVTAAQYDRQLADKMPEIVSDLIDTLEEAGRDQKNKERIIETVLNAVKRLREQGIADAAISANIDLEYRGRQLFERGAALLTSEGVRERLKRQIGSVLEKSEDRTVGELSEEWLSMPREELARKSAAWITERLRRPETVTRIRTATESIVHQLLSRGREEEPENSGELPEESEGANDIEREKARGNLFGLSDEGKQRLVDAAATQFEEIIDTRVPQIVTAIDIHTLVVNKIDSLDVAHVERLLLGVISRHLKWINLFGALLGALIGGSQVMGALFLWG